MLLFLMEKPMTNDATQNANQKQNQLYKKQHSGWTTIKFRFAEVANSWIPWPIAIQARKEFCKGRWRSIKMDTNWLHYCTSNQCTLLSIQIYDTCKQGRNFVRQNPIKIDEGRLGSKKVDQDRSRSMKVEEDRWRSIQIDKDRCRSISLIALQFSCRCSRFLNSLTNSNNGGHVVFVRGV